MSGVIIYPSTREDWAQLFGKGRLKVGDTFRNESLTGTIFSRLALHNSRPGAAGKLIENAP